MSGSSTLAAQAVAAVVAASRPRRPEPPERRTFEPARRDSWLAGGAWEGAWRCRHSRRELNALVLAARIYRERLWREGRREGLFTEIGIVMLEKLAAVARRGVRPLLSLALSRWADLCGHSPDTINEQKKRLEAHGFLESRRRIEPTGERGRRGVQVRQVENLYRLQLPEAARRLMGRFGRKPPPPDDHVHEAEQGRALAQAHDAQHEAAAREARRQYPDGLQGAAESSSTAWSRPRLTPEQLADNAAYHASRIAGRQAAVFGPERDSEKP